MLRYAITQAKLPDFLAFACQRRDNNDNDATGSSPLPYLGYSDLVAVSIFLRFQSERARD